MTGRMHTKAFELHRAAAARRTAVIAVEWGWIIIKSLL